MSKDLYTKYPHIAGHEPLNGTWFWRFIENTQIDDWIHCLTMYLKQFGFVLGTHKITSEQLKRHRTCFRQCWYHQLRIKYYEDHSDTNDDG